MPEFFGEYRKNLYLRLFKDCPMLEVSIIIPVYNGLPYIDRCLEAIVASRQRSI